MLQSSALTSLPEDQAGDLGLPMLSLTQALGLSRDCAVVLDGQGRILHINAAGCRHLAIDRTAEWLGQSWPEFWPEAERPSVLAAISRARTEGHAQFEGLCPTALGAPRWWDVQISRLADAAADVRLVCVARDVSLLHQAHLLSARQAQTLQTALDSGELGHWSHSLDTGELTCSEVFREHFGLPDTGPISVDMVLERISSDTLPAFRAARDAALRAGGSHAMEVHTVDRAQCERVLMTHFHVEEPLGGGRQVSGISVDLTAQRQRAGADTETQDLVGRMVHDRTKLLSDLHAHMIDTIEQERKQLARDLHDEMGSLLTLMSFEVARLGQRFQDQAEQVPEAARLQDLIGDLRQYKHRVVAGLRPPLLQELGLEMALQNLIDNYSQSSGLHVQVAIDSALPPLIEAAALAVFRLVQECLTNIGKYARAKTVQIDLTCDDTHLVIEVSDDGIGLPPNALSGSRFGLVGMRERILAFGGTAIFERISEAGGTRVTASLPLCAITEPTA
jgi:PAS domain S-box-containing protein